MIKLGYKVFYDESVDCWVILVVWSMVKWEMCVVELIFILVYFWGL